MSNNQLFKQEFKQSQDVLAGNMNKIIDTMFSLNALQQIGIRKSIVWGAQIYKENIAGSVIGVSDGYFSTNGVKKSDGTILNQPVNFACLAKTFNITSENLFIIARPSCDAITGEITGQYIDIGNTIPPLIEDYDVIIFCEADRDVVRDFDFGNNILYNSFGISKLNFYLTGVKNLNDYTQTLYNYRNLSISTGGNASLVLPTFYNISQSLVKNNLASSPVTNIFIIQLYINGSIRLLIDSSANNETIEGFGNFANLSNGNYTLIASCRRDNGPGFDLSYFTWYIQ